MVQPSKLWDMRSTSPIFSLTATKESEIPNRWKYAQERILIRPLVFGIQGFLAAPTGAIDKRASVPIELYQLTKN